MNNSRDSPVMVRIVARPNTNFCVGYPGIHATLPRIEGTVEIRANRGVAAPATLSVVTISLHRVESIHPSADSLAKKHLGPPRKTEDQVIGKEMLLYRTPGRENEEIVAMDLPFVLFIPKHRGGVAANKVPPGSLCLPSRTAETFYELRVQVRYDREGDEFRWPVPLIRYDTLSTFGMYNKPPVDSNAYIERVSDHLATLAINLPRWSYGPLDNITVYVKLLPNQDWLIKARKVTIQKITISIEQEVIYNHEGDDPVRKSTTLAKKTETVGIKMPDNGYYTNIGMLMPAEDRRDNMGVLPRASSKFPYLSVAGFTTTAGLYRVEYFLSCKAHLSNAKDIVANQAIVVCPLDHASCKAEMEAVEASAREATSLNTENPMLPLAQIVRANQPDALRALGLCMVGGVKRPWID